MPALATMSLSTVFAARAVESDVLVMWRSEIICQCQEHEHKLTSTAAGRGADVKDLHAGNQQCMLFCAMGREANFAHLLKDACIALVPQQDEYLAQLGRLRQQLPRGQQLEYMRRQRLVLIWAPLPDARAL